MQGSFHSSLHQGHLWTCCGHVEQLGGAWWRVSKVDRSKELLRTSACAPVCVHSVQVKRMLSPTHNCPGQLRECLCRWLSWSHHHGKQQLS